MYEGSRLPCGKTSLTDQEDSFTMWHVCMSLKENYSMWIFRMFILYIYIYLQYVISCVRLHLHQCFPLEVKVQELTQRGFILILYSWQQGLVGLEVIYEEFKDLSVGLREERELEKTLLFISQNSGSWALMGQPMCCPQQSKTCLWGQSECHVVCEPGKALLVIVMFSLSVPRYWMQLNMSCHPVKKYFPRITHSWNLCFLLLLITHQ